MDRSLLVAARCGLHAGVPVRPLFETVRARAGIESVDVPFAAGRRGTVPVVNDCVDLTPFVREDMLLELSAASVVQTGLRGLKK
jgi:hypothetical protein